MKLDLVAAWANFYYNILGFVIVTLGRNLGGKERDQNGDTSSSRFLHLQAFNKGLGFVKLYPKSRK
jgi:hypothetical protein